MNTSNDALDILKGDHDMVKKAFKLFEGLAESEQKEKKRLSSEICSALTMHTTMEEELFYPVVRAEVSEAKDLVDEASVEHAGAKDLIAQIEAMDPDEELFDATVTVLREQIEHHVEEEENEMFPMIRKSKLDTEAIWQEMLEWKEKNKVKELSFE